MKRFALIIIESVLSVSILAGCSAAQTAATEGTAGNTQTTAAEETAEGEGTQTNAAGEASEGTQADADPASESVSDTVTIRANIGGSGFGQIAYDEEGEKPEFSDEYPMQSVFMNVEKGSKVGLGARADEGNKFLKWTAEGQAFSKEEFIVVTAEKDIEYIAVFGPAGKDETYVDLEKVEELGELLGLPEYGSSMSGNRYAYAFEQDGVIYRAVAELPQDVSEALWALDWEDEQYEEKEDALLAPLKVLEITDLSEGIPSQEELDQLVGKTGGELLEDGWYCTGWTYEDTVFYMGHGPYNYQVTFNETVDNWEDFNEYEDLNDMTVASVTYDGFGDVAFIEEEEEDIAAADVPKSEQTGTAGSNIPLKDNHNEAEYQIRMALQDKIDEMYGDDVDDARIYVDKVYTWEDEQAVEPVKEMKLGMNDVAFEATMDLHPAEGADVNMLLIPNGEYDEESGWVKGVFRLGVLRESGGEYVITDFGTGW